MKNMGNIHDPESVGRKLTEKVLNDLPKVENTIDKTRWKIALEELKRHCSICELDFKRITKRESFYCNSECETNKLIKEGEKE